MFTVGTVYLNPYRNEISRRSVLELILSAEYLEHAEAGRHFPIISYGIIVFVCLLARNVFRFVYNICPMPETKKRI
jgi:hypothetical protein